MKVRMREILQALRDAPDHAAAERIVGLLNEQEHAALARWSEEHLGSVAGMYVGGLLDLVRMRHEHAELAATIETKEEATA